MSRYRMTLMYDGTAYAGWQVQKRGPSIQGTVEERLRQILQQRVRIHGSGRTDAGVHARGQVAHFDAKTDIPPDKLHRGLNALLPDDIRVSNLRTCAPDFHARFGAVGKEYRYFIWNGPVVPPFVRGYRAQIRYALDIEAMREAARTLEGEHDFASFTANPNREVHGTVRTVYALEVRKSGHEIQIRAHGSGFLYKMVRTLAGCLIEVGRGGLEPDRIPDVIQQRKRTRLIPTAPAEGLFLWKVIYS